MPNINLISELLAGKKYTNLKDLFDKSIELEPEDLAQLFSNLENEYGIIKQSQFQGFEFKDTNNFGQVIKVNVVQIREKVALTMALVFNKNNQNLIAIEFE